MAYSLYQARLACAKLQETKDYYSRQVRLKTVNGINFALGAGILGVPTINEALIHKGLNPKELIGAVALSYLSYKNVSSAYRQENIADLIGKEHDRIAGDVV